jgi:VIT1/CCC1 family predicted Fe2+/Mn2+ transporter
VATEWEREKRGFLHDEVVDRAVYLSIASHEKNAKMRSLLIRLAEDEKRHADIWRSLVKGGDRIGDPPLLGMRTFFFSIMKRLLGMSFVTKLLERGESNALVGYGAALGSRALSRKERELTMQIINDEKMHEASLAGALARRDVNLAYMQSKLLGLNDGLVEILAVAAGVAAVATTSFIVVIIGLITGISGTLSMAGGVYLSSKSEHLVTDKGGAAQSKISPAKEAYNTGAYYLLGVIAVIAPFALGLKGPVGIACSVAVACVVLVIASAVVAIISGTSVRRRSLEMLAISLGAAAATVLFSTFAKAYFGVQI